MANRTVLARLTIDGVDGVVAGFKKSGEAAVEYGRVAQKAGTTATRWIDKHSSELSNIGGSLLKVGAIGTVALGGLAKSAVDWESSWAGVTKTVDGTPAQMEALEQSLRDMTRVLPSTHEEIAAVAEAAGQLGVGVEDVESFTRTMIDLGETTNLSSDEAATSLAQLMNVMGTSQKHVSRLGSAVVALGNDGASTERDIVSMAQRIAAAGNQVGMTEADVLGMASALSSVGIEAEAGGTAVSLTLRQIDGFVRDGGRGLQQIAQISGVSAEEFSTAWRDDAAGAVATFVEGLGDMQAAGGDVNAVLEDLGMTGIRQSDALLRLAGATKAAGTEQDLLREALALGATAWEENTALAEEAEKRYQTRAAQAQMAMNSIRDEAINLGQELLPVVDSVLSAISGIAEVFGDLDGSTRSGLAAVGLIAGAFALATGGVLKAVAALSSFKAAIAGLGITARTATLAMGGIGIALTVAGFALGAFLGEQAKAKAHVDALTDAIRRQGTVIGGSTREVMSSALYDSGALHVAEKLGLDLATVTDAALGSKSALAEMNAELANGIADIDARIEKHQQEADAIADKIDAGTVTEDEAARWTELQNAIGAARAERGEWISGQASLESVTISQSGEVAKAADAARMLAETTGDSADASEDAATAAQAQAEAQAQMAMSAEEAARAQQELLDATLAQANAMLQLSGSQIGMNSAIADLNARMEELNAGGAENARTLDLATESGRKNQQALDGVARASMSVVETMYEQSASAGEIAAETARAREEWLKGAAAMGVAEEDALALADAYFAIPGGVGTTLEVEGLTGAMAAVASWEEKLAGISEEERTNFLAQLNQGSVAEVEAAWDRLTRARSMNIAVRYVTMNLPPAARDRVDQHLYRQAHGGILAFGVGGFAGGPDIANRHIAEIAPKGSYRMFGEEETEGEAYIPFRRDTRQRSLAIWREAGRRLGVRGFSYGAISSHTATSATLGSSVNVGDIHVHVQGGTSEQMLDDFARQLPAVIAGSRRP